MTPTGGRTPQLEVHRGLPGSGSFLVVAVSLACGVVGVLPFVMAAYAAVELVLAPLGLAPADPTNDDGTTVVVICGVVAPLVVLAGWAALVAAIVRRHGLGGGGWGLAAAGLAAPTLAFVASRLG